MVVSEPTNRLVRDLIAQLLPGYDPEKLVRALIAERDAAPDDLPEMTQYNSDEQVATLDRTGEDRSWVALRRQRPPSRGGTAEAAYLRRGLPSVLRSVALVAGSRLTLAWKDVLRWLGPPVALP